MWYLQHNLEEIPNHPCNHLSLQLPQENQSTKWVEKRRNTTTTTSFLYTPLQLTWPVKNGGYQTILSFLGFWGLFLGLNSLSGRVPFDGLTLCILNPKDFGVRVSHDFLCATKIQQNQSWTYHEQLSPSFHRNVHYLGCESPHPGCNDHRHWWYDIPSHSMIAYWEGWLASQFIARKQHIFPCPPYRLIRNTQNQPPKPTVKRKLNWKIWGKKQLCTKMRSAPSGWCHWSSRLSCCCFFKKINDCYFTFSKKQRLISIHNPD